MMLSFAMACSSRGAPVSDCRPAPHVEKKEPITMTQGDGHARVPTTRLPLTESPNLERWESFNLSEFLKSQKKKLFFLSWQNKSKEWVEKDWLVSEDDPLDAGSEQHHAAQVCKSWTQENNLPALKHQSQRSDICDLVNKVWRGNQWGSCYI